MSNSSMTSIVFERYMIDSLALRDLFNQCLTSPKDLANSIRSDALAIQSRWESVELLATQGGSVSRSFGVETIAEDINAYLTRPFKRVGAYLGGLLRALINVRAAFPNAQDDYEGAMNASVALDAGLKASGDLLLKFLSVASVTFNDVNPRDDDRDVLRYLKYLDETFASVAHFLSPDVRIEQSPAFQLTDVDDGDIPAVRITGNSNFTAATPAGDWVSFPTSRKSAALTINHLAAPVAHQIAHAKPGGYVVMMKVVLGGQIAAGIPVTVTGAGVQIAAPATVTSDYISDSSGLRHYTISFRTTVAGGAINLSIGITGNVTEWGTVDILSVERYSGAVTSYSTGSVLDAVNAGPASYFAFTWRQPQVRAVLNLLSARDSIARARGHGTLRDVLVGVWKSAVTQAGFSSNANVLNAFDQMTVSLPYTSAFWASDPVGINAVLIAAGIPQGYAEEWVKDAYERMYIAFYDYLGLCINAGNADALLPSRV